MADYEIPDDLQYTKDDEWCRAEGDRIVVGITDYAQQQLGDVVFIELPEVGSQVVSGKPFGVIESVKAVSDLYAPVSGEVLATNDDLTDRPELVNESCYTDGWMIAVSVGDGGSSDLDEGLDTEAYRAYVAERSD